MSLPLSSHVQTLAPSPTLQVSQRAKELRAQGFEILDLSAGEPDFATPEPVCQAARQALADGWTRYTPVAGIPELREKICEAIYAEKGLSYHPDQVVVSTGAKQALFNAILATISPGDEVLLPSPYWVSYTSQIQLAGGRPVFIPTQAKQNFALDPALVAAAITPKTRMLILNSPNNPTGAVYPVSTLRALADLALEHRLWLLCDEIYDRLVYHGSHVISPMQKNPAILDQAILINGFSKAYAMTGWRLGYMIAPLPIAKAAIALQGAVSSGGNSIAQRAALAALDLPPSVIEGMRFTFERRLDAMLSALSSIPGLFVPRPSGTFYVFPDVSSYLGKVTPKGLSIPDTASLARYLLEDAHVAVVPGEAFGAPGHLRLSYATHDHTLQRAVSRLRQALLALEP